MSSKSTILATCQKKRNHLSWTSGSSCNCGGEPLARSHTSALVTRSVYGVREYIRVKCCQRRRQGSCQ